MKATLDWDRDRGLFLLHPEDHETPLRVARAVLDWAVFPIAPGSGVTGWMRPAPGTEFDPIALELAVCGYALPFETVRAQAEIDTGTDERALLMQAEHALFDLDRAGSPRVHVVGAMFCRLGDAETGVTGPGDAGEKAGYRADDQQI